MPNSHGSINVIWCLTFAKNTWMSNNIVGDHNVVPCRDLAARLALLLSPQPPYPSSTRGRHLFPIYLRRGWCWVGPERLWASRTTCSLPSSLLVHWIRPEIRRPVNNLITYVINKKKCRELAIDGVRIWVAICNKVEKRSSRNCTAPLCSN